MGGGQIKLHLTNFCHKPVRLKWPLCVCAACKQSCFSCSRLLVDDLKARVITGVTSTRFTVTSHLLNILVYGAGMVGEDVALNYDPHSGTQRSRADANKQSHSALPRPDNGWLVWGVKSNETGREQQLSVCAKREEGW